MVLKKNILTLNIRGGFRIHPPLFKFFLIASKWYTIGFPDFLTFPDKLRDPKNPVYFMTSKELSEKKAILGKYWFSSFKRSYKNCCLNSGTRSKLFTFLCE